MNSLFDFHTKFLDFLKSLQYSKKAQIILVKNCYFLNVYIVLPIFLIRLTGQIFLSTDATTRPRKIKDSEAFLFQIYKHATNPV